MNTYAIFQILFVYMILKFFWLKMLGLICFFPHFKAVLKVTNAYPNWQNSLSEEKSLT